MAVIAIKQNVTKIKDPSQQVYSAGVATCGPNSAHGLLSKLCIYPARDLFK